MQEQTKANPTKITLKSALELCEADISKAYEEKTPRNPALMLISKVTGKPTAFILAHPETLLDKKQRKKLKKCLSRIKKAEPLQYIVGSTGFFGLSFRVNKHTLIPRPETEFIVEEALDWIKSYKRTRNEPLNILDIGTGSGCIIISFVKQFDGQRNDPKNTRLKEVEINWFATDISKEALEVAKENATANLGKSYPQMFVLADLFPSQKQFKGQKFDLITANLPYIPESEYESLPTHIKDYEPEIALVAGKDGLDIIRRFLKLLPDKLNDNGVAILEFLPKQEKEVRKICEKAGFAVKKSRKCPYIYLISRAFSSA